MVRIAKHFKIIPSQVATTLYLYSLSKQDTERILPVLEKHRGKGSRPSSYCSKVKLVLFL